MFDGNQSPYLIRQLSRNNVVLFLGAGFSVNATNASRRAIPTSNELAALLWSLLETDESYGGESLGEVFQAVIARGVNHDTIQNFLEYQLMCRDVPAIYDVIARPFWHRIYTTNVDDLLPTVYNRAGTAKLQILAFPRDEVSERDQSLHCIQAVYLNGRLPCGPDELTFSPRQYGKAASRRQPLYEQFIRDYSVKPVVFVGTRLEEPLFWQALAERGNRSDDGENRPQSFLVTPTISVTKRMQLEELNVEPILLNTQQFLSWLGDIEAQLPSRTDVVRAAVPDLAAILEGEASTKANQADLKKFGKAFAKVPLEVQQSDARSLYLLGAAPRWDDLLRDLDAPRDVTTDIAKTIDSALESKIQSHVIAVLGTAGCGKSTIVRRAGLRLAREGRLVFITNSETLPPPEALKNVLAAYPEPAVLIFDNAEVALSQLPELIARTVGLPNPPVFVIASRTNDFDRLWRRIEAEVHFDEFVVPNLNRAEILAVVKTLERNGLLGKLQGATQQECIRAFEQVARKQILIAMRDATTSIGFDLIIRDEFERLVPVESQVLYLCVALATDAGYRLTREEFIGCSSVSPSETLTLLSRNLRDIVVGFGGSSNLLMLRHRLIASLIVDNMAPRALLAEAYVRVLTSLAIHSRRDWRERASGLMKALINHRVIYERFRFEIDEARAIFGSLTAALGGDAHFWLQFGNLELEGTGGDLAFAENYLRQAEALNPSSEYIQNALGHLLIKKGVYASDIESASQLRRVGSEILKNNIHKSRFRDAYAVHIFCRQTYEWVKRWLVGDPARKGELESLRSLIDEAVAVHPRHRRLSRLKGVLDRAYLQMAIPREKRPPLPSVDDV